MGEVDLSTHTAVVGSSVEETVRISYFNLTVCLEKSGEGLGRVNNYFSHSTIHPQVIMAAKWTASLS